VAGVLVSGATTYGVVVGVGSNGPLEVPPTYPFAYVRKADAQIRFSVDVTGVTAGSQLWVSDPDVDPTPWKFIQRPSTGVLGIFRGSIPVLDLVPASAGGPQIAIKGSTSGNTNIGVAAVASGIWTLPSTTDTFVGRATPDTLANKTLNTASNTFTVNGVSLDTSWTAYTPTVTSGSGAFTTVSATGAYKQVGKTVFVRIAVTITTNGSATGRVEATLPVAVSVGLGSQALSGFNDTAATVLATAISPTASTTKVLMFTAAGAYPGANATALIAQGVYEVP
jgi:hypothetical protein